MKVKVIVQHAQNWVETVGTQTNMWFSIMTNPSVCRRESLTYPPPSHLWTLLMGRRDHHIADIMPSISHIIPYHPQSRNHSACWAVRQKSIESFQPGRGKSRSHVESVHVLPDKLSEWRERSALFPSYGKTRHQQMLHKLGFAKLRNTRISFVLGWSFWSMDVNQRKTGRGVWLGSDTHQHHLWCQKEQSEGWGPHPCQ